MLNRSRKFGYRDDLLESEKNKIKYFKNLGYFGSMYLKNVSNESKEKIEKADDDVKNAAKDLELTLRKLKSARDNIIEIVPNDCTCDSTILNKLISDYNSTESKENIDFKSKLNIIAN